MSVNDDATHDSVATDLLFLSQGEAPSLDLMILTYGGSYLLVFGTELQLLPIAATFVASATIIVASSSWAKLSDELIEKRVESDERSRVDELTGLATRAAATQSATPRSRQWDSFCGRGSPRPGRLPGSVATSSSPSDQNPLTSTV